MQLVKYDAACQALAAARSIDEVKEISGRAEAARAYARQVKNRGLEIDAMEIRVRAERRLGEIIIEMKSQNIIGCGTLGRATKRPVTLPELGINGVQSASAQRLAMLPEQKFTKEMGAWRETAETRSRAGVKVPLQFYRHPSLKAVEQRKAAHKATIDPGDRFDKFRSVDGRRVADWRVGELRRLADLAYRMFRCAERLNAEMPVANPDSLATMEMIYRADDLEKILTDLWDETHPDSGDAGFNANRIRLAQGERMRNCESCGTGFIPGKPGSKARAGLATPGRFCSTECAHEWAKKKK